MLLQAARTVCLETVKKFTYFAPGAQRIAEKASPPVKDRSHTITTTINYTGNEEGVLGCLWWLHRWLYDVHSRVVEAYFDYNYYNGLYYTLESQAPCQKGKNTIRFSFVRSEAKRTWHAGWRRGALCE